MNAPLATIVVAAGLGVVAGTLVLRSGAAGSEAEDRSLGNHGIHFDDLADFVANKDAIAVVESTGAHTETVVAFATPSAWPTENASEHAAVAAMLASQPFTNYEAVVTEALLDDGQLPNGTHFLLRQAGHPSDWVGALTDVAEGYPIAGRAYLVLLWREAPGIYAPWYGAKFLVDGASVTYPNGTPLDLAAGMTPAAFLDAVRDAIDSSGP